MRKYVFSILLIIAFCFGAHETFAQCACHPETPFAKTEFNKSDVVFVGKVIETKKITRDSSNLFEAEIKFEVKQVWKRDLEKFVVIKITAESEKGFEQNSEWLVYAFEEKGGTLTAVVHCCTRTKPLSVVADDLKRFKKMGEKQKKIIENNN